jgi:hypothetical protein
MNFLMKSNFVEIPLAFGNKNKIIIENCSFINL